MGQCTYTVSYQSSVFQKNYNSSNAIPKQPWPNSKKKNVGTKIVALHILETFPKKKEKRNEFDKSLNTPIHLYHGIWNIKEQSSHCIKKKSLITWIFQQNAISLKYAYFQKLIIYTTVLIKMTKKIRRKKNYLWHMMSIVISQICKTKKKVTAFNNQMFD